MLERKLRVHFVGVGGIGMSALALLLSELGHDVSGSDLRASSQTEKLRELGIEVFVGRHREQNLRNPDLVVVSSAVPDDNAEVVEAKRRGIHVASRGDLLAELMAEKRGIAVAGSHGKTTTTAMIAMLLLNAGLDPTCLVGGVVNQLGGNARLGKGEYLVAETDESDRSFLKLQPEMAVITNIDLEHMVAYRGEEELMSAFQQFANRLPDPSRCVLCVDDLRVRRILPGIHRHPITYGFRNSACLTAECIEETFQGSRFRVRRQGQIWGDVRLPVPGTHNVLNSLSVIGISLLLGIAPEMTLETLSHFGGVTRRMENKGSAGGVLFYDDYGHHPTEIQATLKTARSSRRRLVVIFQPHRYTRTRDLFAAFAGSFQDADVLFVMDIYSAGEDPLAGVSAARLAEAISRAGHPTARFAESWQIVEEVLKTLREGDLLLTVGAGDVYRVGEEILQRWRGNDGN
ncbi:MAG: UDP-N-acetylmuramate--L-alanine ligase [Acidobacteria bacterium]|nr:UDP-N-acetylmuramate--L-alanine ligase [Acidobacteriota bacterium]